MEEVENERLPKIVPAAFGKMGSKSTLDLTTWKPPIANSKKNRKLSIYQAKYSSTGSEPCSGFFLLSSKGT